MKAYFLSVILTAVFGGICEELLPESSTVRPHVKLVTGICVLAVLALPAKDLLVGMGEFFGTVDFDAFLPTEEAEEDYGSVFEDALSRHSAEEAGRYLSELLIEEFELREGTCRAEIFLSEEGAIERVLVCLSGTSILRSPYEIESYVNERLSCPCDVAVE